ncbi:MAG TPA: heme-binding domain-containing protein [Segetibacter sp.]
MKTSGIILTVVLIVLIFIQFFHPAKNISTVKSPTDIAVLHKVPVNVRTILDKACNDCHSNNTRYPWYNNIQPVAWWLDNHVQEGKAELNFNEFATYSLRKQYHKLEEVTEQVKEGEMPLGSYTLVHTNAKLTEQEKEKLINWANSIRSEMKAKYPKDSLVRKR